MDRGMAREFAHRIERERGRACDHPRFDDLPELPFNGSGGRVGLATCLFDVTVADIRDEAELNPTEPSPLDLGCPSLTFCGLERRNRAKVCELNDSSRGS